MDKTLAKGLGALEWLTRQQKACRVIELAQALGIAQSNAHRTLQTLVQSGWVNHDKDSSTYRASLLLFELGALVEEVVDIIALLRPHLAGLSQQTCETIHLATLDKVEIVYLDKFDSSLPVAAYSRIGGRAPSHCVAAGKSLLAVKFQHIETLRQHVGEMVAYTPYSITSLETLEKDLQMTRSNGFAQNHEEWRLGVCGLGAPVFNARGEPVAAIGMSVPSTRFSKARVREFSKKLISCARAASATLGFQSQRPISSQ